VLSAPIRGHLFQHPPYTENNPEGKAELQQSGSILFIPHAIPASARSAAIACSIECAPLLNDPPIIVAALALPLTQTRPVAVQRDVLAGRLPRQGRRVIRRT